MSFKDFFPPLSTQSQSLTCTPGLVLFLAFSLSCPAPVVLEGAYLSPATGQGSWNEEQPFKHPNGVRNKDRLGGHQHCLFCHTQRCRFTWRFLLSSEERQAVKGWIHLLSRLHQAQPIPMHPEHLATWKTNFIPMFLGKVFITREGPSVMWQTANNAGERGQSSEAGDNTWTWCPALARPQADGVAFPVGALPWKPGAGGPLQHR